MKKFISMLLCAAVLTTSIPVWAQEDNKSKTMDLTLEKAIETSMKNNMTLKGVKIDIESSGISLDKAQYNERKLRKGERTINRSKDQLSNLEKFKQNMPDGVTLDQIAQGNSPLKDIASSILKDNPGLGKLDNKGLEQNVINPGKESIKLGQETLDMGIITANDVLAKNLNLDASQVLSVKSTGDLMVTMAQLKDTVTVASYEMAEKKIALLTRQKYYEIIKNKKIEQIKKTALDRAQKQYSIAKTAYEVGMKAKDDMLLAKDQYELFKVAHRKAVMDRRNSETELKNVMNINPLTEISLKEDFSTNAIQMDLKSDMNKAIQNRIESKKVMAQYLIEKLNLDNLKVRYPENTFQYQEADNRLKKSTLELEKQLEDIKAEVIKSNESVLATQEMYSYTEGVVENAKKALEIAQYRYQEGYGIDSAALKSANLEDFSGTIIEVLNAQEVLLNAEEKVIDILFNYNLAKDKYLTDIGDY